MDLDIVMNKLAKTVTIEKTNSTNGAGHLIKFDVVVSPSVYAENMDGEFTFVIAKDIVKVLEGALEKYVKGKNWFYSDLDDEFVSLSKIEEWLEEFDG